MVLSQLQITTATDGAGTNCHERALAALEVFPALKAVIGSLLLQGCRDQRDGRPIGWVKPWGHHIWLIEPNGDHYDPSAPNLEHWAQLEEMSLPRPWQQLSVGVIEAQREQARIVGQIIGGYPTGANLPDAIYLPGLVYSSNLEERPASPSYVTAWGRLASESVRAGGWSSAQLRDALTRVEELMAGPPRIRSAEVPMRRAGRGFAQEVA